MQIFIAKHQLTKRTRGRNWPVSEENNSQNFVRFRLSARILRQKGRRNDKRLNGDGDVVKSRDKVWKRHFEGTSRQLIDHKHRRHFERGRWRSKRHNRLRGRHRRRK